MVKRIGLTKLAGGFSEDTVAAVWKKGHPISGAHPDYFRTDDCGAWIAREDYGNVDAELGWQIDHILPKALGGEDDLKNLRPLHWKNNAKKSDTYPWDPSDEKADVPLPALAVLLEASGKLQILPVFEPVSSIDDFWNYLRRLAPGATSVQRVARDYQFQQAHAEASQGRTQATALLLQQALETARV